MLPGAPELPEPSALRRLPADLPTHPPSASCRPGNSPTVAAVPGLALSSLLPTGLGRRRQQRGRQRPSREEAAAAGPVMGLGVRGGGCRLVLSRDRPSGAVEEWSTQSRADGGVRNEGGLVGSGRGAGN